MKKSFSLILLILFCPFASLFSQDCSEAQVRKLPGIWQAGLKGSIYGVNANDLVKEREVLGNIHKMVSSKYSPTGCQVTYSMAYSTQSYFWADPYSYNMYIKRYLCNHDKPGYYVDVATSTTVKININEAPFLNSLYAADLREDPRGYLKLRERPKLKDGVYFMGQEAVGDSHMENKIMEYRWLIAYDDQLPFSYVNRKEYLLLLKPILEKNIGEWSGQESYLKEFLNNINNYLKKPESELSKVAVCMWNQEERFIEFVEEGTKGSFIAVKPNPDYFKKLPRYSPQFITVVYKIKHGDPIFEDNIDAVQKAVDFSTLKSMLGK